MTALADTLVAWLRAWIGCLRTQQHQPGRASRLWRAMLLVPAFGAVLTVLHVKRRVSGALERNASIGEGAGNLRCRMPDLIGMYIGLFDIWEPDVSALLVERLRPGDAFLDVGANIGYYPLLASACVGDTGQAVAIEASPGIFAELCGNLERSAASNVRALHAAVSDHEGEIGIYAGPSHNLGLTTTVPGARRGLRQEAMVRAAPLGSLLSAEEVARARLLKIDVEGGEPAVIAGMAGFLAGCRDDLEILLELSPGWWGKDAPGVEAVIAPLRAAGFHTYVMDNSYWPWRYLWPRAVRRPRRVHRLSDRRVKRIDLMLSRVDAEQL